ncbi:MAG: hypothetical protein KGP28_03595, partial [Bdellovibrionales bacterium]|nr:hypothetical protein [Bdellovibrionales bacterium]
LSNLHWKQLKKVEFEINNRPMKCLDWRTPYELMMKKSCTAFVWSGNEFRVTVKMTIGISFFAPVPCGLAKS